MGAGCQENHAFRGLELSVPFLGRGEGWEKGWRRVESISGQQLSQSSLGNEAEKAMAPHSSTLAWKIPWMEEPGGLQSMGSLRVGHD